jgi:hypothetical protein
MATNPTQEDVARAILAELYAVKSALAQANDKIKTTFGAGFEIIGADVLYNDPNNMCSIMDIPLLLDGINLSTQEVEIEIFQPQGEDDLRIAKRTTNVFVASCVPSCNTPYPKGPGDAGCCGPNLAWKRYSRGYYCCSQSGCA